MDLVFKNLSEDDADTYRLVLSSTGISHHLEKGGHGWDIRVNDTDYEKAVTAIEEYQGEPGVTENRRPFILQIPEDIYRDMGIYSIDRMPCRDCNR